MKDKMIGGNVTSMFQYIYDCYLLPDNQKSGNKKGNTLTSAAPALIASQRLV